ncbi:Gon7 family protein [Plectosphaerella plurivora]|uniref:EKC/KEOPS complex subunit GON7 n=1 Tax=Plectosphaerella plurivora TaxID=936078 RepID=A0A9P8VEV8_9PEZI|nr:Gon7 family protein [Plectosphaerella plurivora]
MASEAPQNTLRATYSAPDAEPFAYELPVQAPSSASPTDRAASLARLRATITQVQADINRQLTANMEADKARDAATSGKPVVDDEKEEENYGEEVVAEDD